jgi:transcriptional regulator with XRE-family HTH domain
MKTDWLGGRLRELRERVGLTQAQLAEKMGVQRLAVARWEAGSREPSWTTILALCNVLGVDCRAFTQDPVERDPAGPGRPRKASAVEEAAKVEEKPKKTKKKRNG